MRHEPDGHIDPVFLTAKAVGYLFNPLVFPPLIAVAVLMHFGAPGGEIAEVAMLFVVFFSLVPLVHLVWLLRTHRIQSLEVYDRKNRYAPLAVALGGNVVAFLVIPRSAGTAPELIAALIICQLLNTAIVAAITLRWKISIHAAAVGGFVGVLWFFAVAEWPPVATEWISPVTPALALSSVPLIPLLMWARVRARVHTPAQVIAGAVLGCGLALLELMLLQAWLQPTG